MIKTHINYKVQSTSKTLHIKLPLLFMLFPPESCNISRSESRIIRRLGSSSSSGIFKNIPVQYNKSRAGE